MDSTDEVLQHIRNSMKVSIMHVHRFRRINTIIIVFTIISSIAATFFSGTAAVTVANAASASASAATPGQRDWHKNKAAAVLGMDYATVCAIAAGLSFFSAIFTGLQVAFGLPAKLENASACMGKLMALEFSASMKRQSSDDIEDEYRKVITNYPEFITIKT